MLVATGLVLREVRTSRGISQLSLSLSTGIHRNYIGGIERGEREPTLIKVIMLAETLGISMADLFARVERTADRPAPAEGD
jgi:transcriptional regulator with XRE-family HTH domain